MSFYKEIIDIHAHVLPGVDDGARDMDEALKMLDMAATQGIMTVIATPHGSRRRAVDKLEELTDQLQQKMREKYPGFCVYPGQENFYHDELTERLHRREAYTMAYSRYVLVEFSPQVGYGQLFQGIRKLVVSGYIPILAHVERYGCLRQRGLEELREAGCCMQLNYGSLKGKMFDAEVRWCRRQVQEGKIHLLGTDMHRMDYRPPEIAGALKWLKGHISCEQFRRMTYENPRCLIDNKRMIG